MCAFAYIIVVVHSLPYSVREDATRDAAYRMGKVAKAIGLGLGFGLGLGVRVRVRVRVR